MEVTLRSYREKENVLTCLRFRYQQAKENGLQDTEIFRRYTEILLLCDEN